MIINMGKNSKVFIDHWIAQLKGVGPDLLKDKKRLLASALNCAKKLKLTVVSSHVHQFNPYGLSLALIIAESHFAIHTWPELSYMHIDVFSCSPKTNLNKIEEVLKQEFKPKKIKVRKLEY